jgi:DNA-binding transcriptional regulator YiaG
VSERTVLDFEAIAAEWVRELRGKRSQSAFSRRLGYRSNVVHRWEGRAAWPVSLAATSGFSRYSVARWLSGEAEPKLPELLQLIEASSRRALNS